MKKTFFSHFPIPSTELPTLMLRTHELYLCLNKNALMASSFLTTHIIKMPVSLDNQPL